MEVCNELQDLCDHRNQQLTLETATELYPTIIVLTNTLMSTSFAHTFVTKPRSFVVTAQGGDTDRVRGSMVYRRKAQSCTRKRWAPHPT